METTTTKKQTVDKVTVAKAIKEAFDGSKQRNFEQTVDAGINIKGINFKQPQNRIDVSVELPHPFRSKPKVLLFAKDVNIINLLKDTVNKMVSADEIPNIDKKVAKRLARDYDLFFAEPSVMALVGKHLGQILAPRGKMPKPAPPSAQAVNALINLEIKMAKVSNKKGNNMPTLHFAIGKEKTDAEKMADNFMAIYNKVFEVLPGKMQNVKSVYVKTTMGKPVYIYRV